MYFCKAMRWWAAYLCATLMFGQASMYVQEDLTKPLPEVEKGLATLARSIWQDSVYRRQQQSNEIFLQRLRWVLTRPESFFYPFDSLKMVSILAPQDSTFRIFTWFLVDERQFHHYFGLVQRRIFLDENRYRIKVYVLQDKVDKIPGVEQMALDQNHWLGAYYYKPRYSKYGVLSFPMKYVQINGLTGKRIKKKTTLYVLLGWNGHNRWTNYKIIETIAFDERDTNKVIFGAPVFYWGRIPKYRVVFKYTDNSPFNLNIGYIVLRKGLFNRPKKIKAIVFDHLSMPKHVRRTDPWMIGADGTCDALLFVRRWFEYRKGAFVLIPQVVVFDESIEHYDPKIVKKMAEAERRKFRKYGIYY